MPPESLIDLSHPLTPQTTIYPGDPPFAMHSVCNIPTDGYSVHAVSFGTHTGTHVDAPFHFFAHGQKLHELSLSRFVGRAIIIDVRHLARARGCIQWRDVRESFDRTRGTIGPRSEGKIDMVLFRTGWDGWWSERKYFDHPYFGRDVAEELVEMGVRLVGVDTLSPDETVLVHDEGKEKDDAFAMHEVLLGRDCLICENLTNLGELVGEDSEEVWVSLIPLSLHGADGAPIRAFGWTEKSR
ncbi:putative cyclase [Suillus bovinus]|uniref:putative cyclase n=1 Tax=Suillus bovinus TaxID=48563 RepID=UPI001B877B4E|nr:putative cyclase [Suillus bovinus]KAG2158552.1 putative cyclase [Suillus bovinus]